MMMMDVLCFYPFVVCVEDMTALTAEMKKKC